MVSCTSKYHLASPFGLLLRLVGYEPSRDHPSSFGRSINSGAPRFLHLCVMFILTSAGSCLASFAAMCACQACQGVTREVLRKSARLAYCALFTTAMVLAWVLRDFAKPLIQKIPCKYLKRRLDASGQSFRCHAAADCTAFYQGSCIRQPGILAISGMVSRQYTGSAWATL